MMELLCDKVNNQPPSRFDFSSQFSSSSLLESSRVAAMSLICTNGWLTDYVWLITKSFVMILLCLCATLTSNFSRYQVLVRGQSLPSGACVMCQVPGQGTAWVLRGQGAASCSAANVSLGAGSGVWWAEGCVLRDVMSGEWELVLEQLRSEEIITGTR